MKASSKLVLLIAFVPMLLLFQNCSCAANPQFNGAVSFSSQMENNTSGNGQPYEGKPDPGTYYRLIPELRCGSNQKIYAALQVTETSARLTTLDKQSCAESEQTLSLSDLESPSYNKTYLGFKDGIYEKRIEAPDLDSPDLLFPESWCRSMSPTSQDLDLVVAETLSSQVMTATLRGATLDSSGSAVPASVRRFDRIVRRLESKQLSYQSEGLSVSIDLTTEAQPGKFKGLLAFTNNGASTHVAILCRTGAKLDSQSDVRPSLALDLSSAPLPAAVTFARSSSATYFDDAGVLRTAPSNEPRFEFDPLTFQPKGLLIEGAAANLLPRSMIIDSTFVLEAVRAPGAAVSPDGASNAIKLTESASASAVVHQCGYNVSLSAGTLYTVSYFAKAGTRFATEVGVTNRDGTEDVASFNLSNGTVIEGAHGSIIKATGVQSLKNGWHRVWAVYDAGTGSAQPIVSLRPHKGTVPYGGMYAGDGASHIFLWGAQLEAGTKPSSYIPTQDFPAVREADRATINGFSWFNDSEGSFTIQAGRLIYEPLALGAQSTGLFSLSGAGTESYVVDYSFPASGPQQMTAAFTSSSGTSSQVFASTSTLPDPSQFLQFALAYKAGDSGLVAFGRSEPAPANAPTGFAPQAIYLGESASAPKWNGHIKSLTYWPRRLPNEALLNFTR